MTDEEGCTSQLPDCNHPCGEDTDTEHDGDVLTRSPISGHSRLWRECRRVAKASTTVHSSKNPNVVHSLSDMNSNRLIVRRTQ